MFHKYKKKGSKCGNTNQNFPSSSSSVSELSIAQVYRPDNGSKNYVSMRCDLPNIHKPTYYHSVKEHNGESSEIPYI